MFLLCRVCNVTLCFVPHSQCRKLAKLNLIPFIFGEPFAGVLTQKYTGHVTIFPDMTLVDSLKAISHPSRVRFISWFIRIALLRSLKVVICIIYAIRPLTLSILTTLLSIALAVFAHAPLTSSSRQADMVKYIGGGQRATWSHIPRLQSLQCIEAALEAAHQSLLGMNRALLNPNAVFANGRTNVALASGAHQAVLSLGPHNAVLLDDEDFFPMSRRVSAAATQNAALLSAPFSLDKPSACAHPRSAALNSAAAAKPSSHATASAPPTPAVASINELSLLKVVDLRARLRVAGLPASGTKDALVQRLHAALVASAAVATRSANAVASNSPPPKPPVLPCGSSSLQSPSSGSLPDVAVATATHAATPSKVQPPLISPPPIPQSPSAAASRAANSVSFLTLADGNRDRSAHAPSESDSSVLSQFAPATTAAPSASSLLICQCCLQRASYDQLIDLRTALLARRMELDAGGA